MQPLNKYLAQQDVMEIIATESGFVCLERDNVGWDLIEDPKVNYEFWERLCNVLANINGVVFDEIKQPRLSAVLPGGHRIEAMLGNNIDKKLSIAIRVKRDIERELTDFGLNKDIAVELIHLVNEGCNLIISGGTSSGKTSFLNALMQKIDKNKRILTVEDAREVDLPDTSLSPQYVVSRNEKNATIGYGEIIDHFVRMRPDIVIAGEISVNNAFPALRLLNTGHKGFFCTIHANSPKQAINGAFPQNVQMAGHDSSSVSSWLNDMVDIVVQLKAANTGKIVTDIYHPQTGISRKFGNDEN